MKTTRFELSKVDSRIYDVITHIETTPPAYAKFTPLHRKLDEMALEQICGLYNPIESDFEVLADDFTVSLAYVKMCFAGAKKNVIADMERCAKKEFNISK